MKKPSPRWTLLSFFIAATFLMIGNLQGQVINTIRPSLRFTSATTASTTQDPTNQDVRTGTDEVIDQKIEVVERLAGWNGAGFGQNGGRLSEDLRGNWVMVDSNGGLSGRVIPIGSASLEEIRIYLLNNGRVVTGAGVNEDGQFKFNNVVQGVYSIIGYGSNAFFAFSVNVLGHSVTASDTTPRELVVGAFQNKTTINNDWIKHFSPGIKFRVYGRYSVREGSDDPAKLYGFDGLSTHHPANVPASSIAFQKTAKTADGRFVGRVHQLSSIHGRPVEVRNTKIMLLHEDQVAGATTTDRFGVFEFQDVPVGDYGLVAASVDGMGLVGVSIVEDGSTEAVAFDATMITTESIGWLNSYATEEAYRRAVTAPRNNLANFGACPSCGGGWGQNGVCNQCGQTAGIAQPFCGSCGGQCGNTGVCNSCGQMNPVYGSNNGGYGRRGHGGPYGPSSTVYDPNNPFVYGFGYGYNPDANNQNPYGYQRSYMQNHSRQMNNAFDRLFYPQDYPSYNPPPCDYTRGR